MTQNFLAILEHFWLHCFSAGAEAYGADDIEHDLPDEAGDNNGRPRL
jgi:hypothetical protein